MRPKRFIVLSRIPIFARCMFLAFACIGVLGVVSMLFGLGQMNIGSEDGLSRPATPADAWLPGIFAVIGIGLLLIRYRIAIDVAQRKRITIAGWALWVKRTEVSLASATCIDVGPVEERGNGSGRYTAIPVKAVGPTGVDELSVPRTFSDARILAKRIAAALKLPVGPGLTGSAELQHVEVVDQVIARTGKFDARDLNPPPETRVTMIDVLNGIEIRYPMTRTTRLIVISSVFIPALSLAGFWWFSWRPSLIEPANHSTFAWFFMMAPLFTGVLTSFIAIAAHYRSGLLGRRILLTADGRLAASRRTIATDRIRSIEIVAKAGPGGGLKVVLDTSEFGIAPGLPEPDLRWMRAVIIRSLQQDKK